MNKIKSLDELKQLRQKSIENTNLRITGENNNRTVITVGMATCGIAAGARVTMSVLLDEISKNKLENVSVISTGCLGHCYAEPLVEIRIPEKNVVRYRNVDECLAREIIRSHIIDGNIIDDAILESEV